MLALDQLEGEDQEPVNVCVQVCVCVCASVKCIIVNVAKAKFLLDFNLRLAILYQFVRNTADHIYGQ